MSQAELFEQSAPDAGDGWRVFKGKGGGADVRYLVINEKIVRIDIGTGETLPVTRHSQDRSYTVIPGFGQVQDRGKAFLAKVAMARLILEERAKREAAEAQAADAKRREQEAVDELVRATLAAGNRGGGGCKTYHGASPFADYGPRINPHAEPFAYAKGFLWLLRAPIRAEWVKVYIYCANAARDFGSCCQSERTIAEATGLSRNGVVSAIEGLAEYKLVSVESGKWQTARRRIYFHEHPWMERFEAVGSRREPTLAHDALFAGSRREPHKEQKKAKNLSSHARTHSERAEEKHCGSLEEEEPRPNDDW